MGEDGNALLLERRRAEQELLDRMADHRELDRQGCQLRNRRQHLPAIAIGDSGIDRDNAPRANDKTGIADRTPVLCGDLAAVANQCVDARSDHDKIGTRPSERRVKQDEPQQPSPQAGASTRTSNKATPAGHIGLSAAAFSPRQASSA